MKKDFDFIKSCANVGGEKLFDNRIRPKQRDEDILSANQVFVMVIDAGGIHYLDVTKAVRNLLKENANLKSRFNGKFTLLTANEMAKELRCTEQHLRNLVSKKKLKKGYHYGKLGSKLLFVRERMYEFANLRVLDCERKNPEVI